MFSGYIGEFEIVDDHRSGKIVVNLTGRLNKVNILITADVIVDSGLRRSCHYTDVNNQACDFIST